MNELPTIEDADETATFKSFSNCFDLSISAVLEKRGCERSFYLALRYFFGVGVYPDKEKAHDLLKSVNDPDMVPYAKALHYICKAEMAEEVRETGTQNSDYFFKKACRVMKTRSESKEPLAMLIYAISRKRQSFPHAFGLMKALFLEAAIAGVSAAYLPVCLSSDNVRYRIQYRALAEKSLCYDALYARMKVNSEAFLDTHYELKREDVVSTALFYAIVGNRGAATDSIKILQRAGLTVVYRTATKEILRFSRGLELTPDEELSDHESDLVKGYLLRDPKAKEISVSCKRIDAKLAFIQEDLKAYIPRRRAAFRQYSKPKK